MKKRLLLILSATLVLLSSCVTSGADVNPNVEFSPEDTFYVAQYDDELRLHETIVEVIQDAGAKAEAVYDSRSIPAASTPEISGSGFFIAPDIIVTNSHVLNNETNISYYQNGIEHHATPVFVSVQNDFAILKGDSLEAPVFRLLRSDEYSVAAPVFVLGYPLSDVLGNEIRITNGIVNSLSGLDGDSNTLQISAPIQPGNSGGPVVTDDFGVIGVASSKLSDAYVIAAKNTIAQNVNFAIKSDLVSFLASEYIPDATDEVEYVDSINEAIAATVKVEAGGEPIISGKQYYIDFSYNAVFDLIHWTLTSMKITCADVSTGEVVASASFSGASFSSAKGIAGDLMEQIMQQIF